MREFNVTIVSATINLGAPFSEMIALRGLLPMYFTTGAEPKTGPGCSPAQPTKGSAPGDK